MAINDTSLEERRNQIEAGRSMAASESEPVVHRKRTVVPGNASGKASGDSKPFVAKGHDAVLKACQERKAQVSIKTAQGEMMVGTIMARDRYTISVMVNGETDARIIYKSHIVYFQPKNKARTEE